MTYPNWNNQHNISRMNGRGDAGSIRFEDRMRGKFNGRGMEPFPERIIPANRGPAASYAEMNGQVSYRQGGAAQYNNRVRGGYPANGLHNNYAAQGNEPNRYSPPSNPGHGRAEKQRNPGNAAAAQVSQQAVFRERFWADKQSKLPKAASIANGKFRSLPVSRNKAAPWAAESIDMTKTGIIKKADQLLSKLSVKKEKIVMPEMVIRRTRHSFPASVVFMLTVCMFVVMLLVYGTSLISNISGEISGVQNETAELAQREQELLLQLEIKNDLRLIEDIAVNQYGMIRKNLAEKRYITMSGGDLIELYDVEEVKQAGAFMSLLSAIRFK